MADRSAALSVCGLLPYPLDSAPSQRFRVEQWIPYLRDQHISVDLFPFTDGRLSHLLYKPGQQLAKALALIKAFMRRAARLRLTARYDVILIHRAVCIGGPALLERLLTYCRRPVVFDFDDAIYLLDSSAANRRLAWLKFPGKTGAICRLSTHVVVGNSYLADYARQHNPNVSVVPTSVDTARYRPREGATPHPKVVVGWTGSSTSQAHLEMFRPVLLELLKRRPVELRVISDRQPVLPGVPCVWRPWSAKAEAEEVGQFDIGIMPLPDDQWARGKCACKALQCMAMALPVVCSRVGANCEVIRHGVNGFLAESPDEWITHLTALIDSLPLRRRLGEAARQTVEANYSARHSAKLFGNVLWRAAEQYNSGAEGMRRQSQGAGNGHSQAKDLSPL